VVGLRENVYERKAQVIDRLLREFYETATKGFGHRGG
jgi:hypothetical protein